MLRKWLYKMLKEDGMSDDEVEIIEYGLYCFLLLAVGVIAALAVGLIEGCMIYMVLFLSLFIPLRVYAGGAHMNSLWKCGICSLAIIIVVGLAFKYDVGGGYMDICLGLLCCGTICILAPQDTEIKRLYPSEKKRNAIISRILAVIYLLIFMLLYNIGKLQACKIILASLVVETISLTSGYISNVLRRKIKN